MNSKKPDSRLEIIKKHDIKADPKKLIITYMDDRQPVKIKCEHEKGMNTMFDFLIEQFSRMENNCESY